MIKKKNFLKCFYTRNNLNGDSRRGLGLGLALCKSIVEAHDGKIKVIDNYPRGSIFVINLPLEDQHLCMERHPCYDSKPGRLWYAYQT